MKNNKNFIKNLIFVFVIAAIVILITPTVFSNLKLGSDLKGGFEVLYHVQNIDGTEATSEATKNTYKALLKRIDSLGVNEPEIAIEGTDRIRVKLAGIKNQDEARERLSTVATLTFRDTSDNLLMESKVLKSTGAKVSQDQQGRPAVALPVADKDKFYKETKKVSESTDKTIVIWLDFEEGKDSYANEKNLCGTEKSRCLSAATVSQGFASDVIIQGNFTTDKVTNLVELINSGSLPTKLTEISSRTVGASFGEDSLQKMITAGIIGIISVIVIMIFLYRFAGLISSISLLVYTVLTFGIFWLVGGVLTLPGIAAMVLGIGMAVDSNVINYERIKDEMASGSSLEGGFKKGNKNSIGTIIDANLTTFIVALILFIFGESSVKGFATMLIISIITTMFVMVIFSRALLKLFVDESIFEKHPNLFLGKPKVRKNKFKYVNQKGIFLGIALVAILIGVFSLTTKGLNLGVDFKGGSSISIKSENKLDVDKIKKDIESKNYEIVDIDKTNENNIYIKITNQLSQKQTKELKNKLETDYNANADIGVVSNIVKKELIKNAILSLIIATIAIIIYISFRFQFNYAVGAIIALCHDVFLIFTLFSLMNLEVQTIFIAAILTIIGYSINDTIVTFDRIRENIKKNKPKNKEELETIVDTSLNQIFSRSIITSVTTIATVLSLIIFGSNQVMEFDLGLLAGLIAGTYSSLFIASQIWFVFESKVVGKPKRKKWYEIDEKEEKKIKGINS